MSGFAYLTYQYHKDREAAVLNREIYEAYSFQACPFDPANPSFFIRDRKTSFREWGKNRQGRITPTGAGEEKR